MTFKPTAKKITLDAANAFMQREPFKQANTEVAVHPSNTRMYLHGHLIAMIDLMGNIKVTNAGYFTNVTKERLNGIPTVAISQKNSEWYLNGEKWDGEWTTV